MGHTSTRMVERVYAQLGIEIQTSAVALLPGVYNGEPNEAAEAQEVDVEDNEEPEENNEK
jgi:hypothetical protein